MTTDSPSKSTLSFKIFWIKQEPEDQGMNESNSNIAIEDKIDLAASISNVEEGESSSQVTDNQMDYFNIENHTMESDIYDSISEKIGQIIQEKKKRKKVVYKKEFHYILYNHHQESVIIPSCDTTKKSFKTKREQFIHCLVVEKSERIKKIDHLKRRKKSYEQEFKDFKDAVHPHNLLQFIRSNPFVEFTCKDLLRDLIKFMTKELLEGYCRFFSIHKLSQATQTDNRGKLSQFLEYYCLDKISEDESRSLLSFKPPLFLNPSVKSFYLDNLYRDCIRKRMKNLEYYPLKILTMLYSIATNNNECPSDVKEILMTNDIGKEEQYKKDIDNWIENNDKEGGMRRKISESIKGKDKEMINALAKALKCSISKSNDKKREEFSSMIKKEAFDLKNKELKASKQINKLNDYFKIDKYGSVVSFIGNATSPTGIQVDHDFPDNLGGPNTLENASAIHWRANNIKSDTPKEFLYLKPDGKDWFTEEHFLNAVKKYGIWVMIGKTPCSLDDENVIADLEEIHNRICQYEIKSSTPSSPITPITPTKQRITGSRISPIIHPNIKEIKGNQNDDARNEEIEGSPNRRD